MNSKNLGIVALVVVVVALAVFGVYQFRKNAPVSSSAPAMEGMPMMKETPMQDHEAMSGKDHPQVAEKYACPMHPEAMSDQPGKCSVCGMELIQKK